MLPCCGMLGQSFGHLGSRNAASLALAVTGGIGAPRTRDPETPNPLASIAPNSPQPSPKGQVPKTEWDRSPGFVSTASLSHDGLQFVWIGILGRCKGCDYGQGRKTANDTDAA